MPLLSISAFAADAGHAARDIALAHDAGADSLHIDVMDGHFVTLTGLGTAWMECMRPRISLPIDVHFMTLSPERFILQFAPFGVASMVFHLEGRDEAGNKNILRLIRGFGVRAGLAVSPGTAVEALPPYLAQLDELLIMSSAPGEPGSAFDPRSFGRISAVRAMVDRAGSRARISVDGGLDLRRALECVENGADNVIMGRAFFRHAQPETVAAAIHDNQ